MGWLLAIGGFISTVVQWVSSQWPVISEVGKKIAETVVDVKGIFEGKEDFRESIERIPNAAADNKIFHLKMQSLELANGSQFAERFSANLGIHISNLKIHFHSIKNICLLFEFNKWTYERVEALSSAVFKGKKKNVESDKAQIIFETLADSIVNHYDAFKQTKKLIEAECREFYVHLEDQRGKINEMLKVINKLNNPNKATLANWLTKVTPRIERARGQIAVLEAEMRNIEGLEIPEKFITNKQDKLLD